MNCPQCRSDNPDDSSFCRKCGYRISGSAPQGIAPTLTIDSQGKVLAKGSLFASRYRIEGELGRGGMGVVFKAEDTKLRRSVALKFLPTELSSHAEAKERFLREARAAAGLDHPHICTIYEADEAEGLAYIAMAYVEGRTLASLIAQGPLPVEEALGLAGQIAEGLAEAHKLGIVHRDIKSSNIMLTDRGQAKIMDFGLAKISGETALTKDARTLGTISYMSPEQARGEEVDARTDIWSLGVVFYEMLSGRRPFHSEHEQAVVYGILHEEPRPLRRQREGVPEALDNVVARALAKKRDERYPSTEDLLADLARVRAGLDVSRPRAGHQPDRRKLALAVTAGVVLVGAALFVFLRPKSSAKVYDTIAVMPFVMSGNSTGQEDISDGMTVEVINRLYQVASLKVKASGAVMPFKNSPKSIRETGKELGVKALVMSRISRPPGRLTVAVELVDAATETVLWGKTYEKAMEDVVALQSELSQDVVRNVRVQLAPSEQARLERSQKVVPKAYEKYLKAVEFYGTWIVSADNGLDRQKTLIEEAIALEPDYPPYHTALMWNYLDRWNSLLISYRDIVLPVNEAIKKIVQLDPESSDACVARAQQSFFSFRWRDYLDSLRRSVNGSPGDMGFRTVLVSALGFMGFRDQALEEYQRGGAELKAQDKLDYLPFYINYFSRHYDEALAVAQAYLRAHPEDTGYMWNVSQVLSLKGMHREALDSSEKLLENYKARGEPVFLPFSICRGIMLVRAGKRDEGLAILKEIGRSPARTTLGTCYDFSMAEILAQTGNMNDREDAFRWLERSVAEPHPYSNTYESDPYLDPLRSDPRFAQIIKKAGFPVK